MGIENTNRIFDPKKELNRSANFLDSERRKNIKRSKTAYARLCRNKANGEWVENACSICNGGMLKRIYEFQKENRPQGVICSSCSRKQDRKLLSDLNK